MNCTNHANWLMEAMTKRKEANWLISTPFLPLSFPIFLWTIIDIYALEIKIYTATKNNKKLKDLYQKALEIKSAIFHPKIMGKMTWVRKTRNIAYSFLGIIRECGGKMHMSEKEWEKGHTDFFEAFKNYDEAGSPRRIQCLKYLVLGRLIATAPIFISNPLIKLICWPSLRLIPSIPRKQNPTRTTPKSLQWQTSWERTSVMISVLSRKSWRTTEKQLWTILSFECTSRYGKNRLSRNFGSC